MFFILIDGALAYFAEKFVKNVFMLCFWVGVVNLCRCILWQAFAYTELGTVESSKVMLEGIVRMLFIHPAITVFFAIYFRSKEKKKSRQRSVIPMDRT
ncbi:MAG: hypothetical protein ACKE9I_09220 [Methylophagaceae bacterium]